jgi:hypothetical protein
MGRSRWPQQRHDIVVYFNNGQKSAVSSDVEKLIAMG